MLLELTRLIDVDFSARTSQKSVQMTSSGPDLHENVPSRNYPR